MLLNFLSVLLIEHIIHTKLEKGLSFLKVFLIKILYEEMIAKLALEKGQRKLYTVYNYASL